jgi:hypothetical protein
MCWVVPGRGLIGTKEADSREEESVEARTTYLWVSSQHQCATKARVVVTL